MGLIVLTQDEGAITYTITKTIELPCRGSASSDGGADVISLGNGKVLATDRFDMSGVNGDNGRMYLFDVCAASQDPKYTWTLGDYPRETCIVGTGTVASASKNQNMVTYFPGMLQKDGNGYSVSPGAATMQG